MTKNHLSAAAPLRTIEPDIETSGDDYARRFAGPVGELFLSTQEILANRCLSLLPQRPLRILDVGGGHAQLTPLFLRLGHQVTVQGSNELCGKRLAPLVRDYRGKVTFHVAPLDHLPYDRESFDLVVAFRLLAHTADWEGFLRQTAAIAKTALLFDYASLWGANILTPVLFQIKKRIEGNTRPYFCHSASQLRAVLEPEGFFVRALEKEFLLPMGIYRALGRRDFAERGEALFRRIGLTALLGSPAILCAVRK